MTNLLSEKKPSRINKTYLAIGLVSFILGIFITNKADYFIADHVFSYQSPIVVQTPVIISSKQLATPVAVIVATATPSATPVVMPSEAPKGYNLR